MLRFLTDEHISPVVAEQAVRKCPGIKITAIHDWRDGWFLGTQDPVFLPEAAKDGLTLVSYDPRTLRPLLKSWSEAGQHHAARVFLDAKTIVPQDFGGLIEALIHLWKRERRCAAGTRYCLFPSPARSIRPAHRT